MATLTPSDVDYIRMMSGDDCGAPEDYEISDAQLQRLHDRGLSMATCACTNSLDLTVVLVLRARVAKAAKLFDEDGEGGAGRVSQKRAHLEKDLARWEERCGLSGGVIGIGTLSMGLDTQSVDEFTDMDRYPNQWSWGGFYPS